MKFILFLIIALVVSIPTTLYGGYVGHILWGWFIEPITHVEITTKQMIGINIVLGYFLSSIFIILEKIKNSDTDIDMMERIATLVSNLITTFLVTTFLLFGGWIWHLILL
jgi:hypothetical protein